MNQARTTMQMGHTWFGQGLRTGMPIAVGYVPIALTYGLLGKTHGLSFIDTTAMSIFVFAGAAQFLALQLLGTGAGAIELIVATFVVNIRHFMLTASINERADREHPLKKAAYAFGVTDETFSVAMMQEGRINARFMAGLIAMAYGSWVVFTCLGYTIGSALPQVLQESMNIALYAMFIGLAVPAMRTSRKVIDLFATAAVLNTLFSLLMATGWAIVLATILASVAVEWLHHDEVTANE
ncbi:AzlC family ABC transporter permease [Tuberibacillus sp. Marseille-P3662]|uniref:AzlC family ABC transporter permease n=1 Tax=Tuberibacillus sp. Marseille-P3662 TaxID=1965358 RepID=UPI0020CADE23|nr:AzlC family ABC transporter permease [Tuberibacillus sp. Marseille-P3662]